MGIRSKLAEEKADFVDGFRASAGETNELFSPPVEQSLHLLVGLSRVLLYGFLLAYPGVPLLPWGRSGPIVAAVAAAALSMPQLRGRDVAQAVRCMAVVALMAATLRLGAAPATSIVLIGSFLACAASMAQSFPAIYGVTAGVAVGAVAIQMFDANLFSANQLLLSGRGWTPDRAGDEALHIAGFMFLAALIHFGRFEREQLKSRAEAAEAARDAAVVDERARIARELHDVVSHHVTAMTLQAEAAAITGDKNALTAVASAGREALTELRRMLGVLRHPDTDSSADELAPQPGLVQLDALAARTSTGPAVIVERRGDVRPLSAGLELGVYRLVQESLTNTAKHSDATTVEVVLTYGESELIVDVRDNGRPLVAARVGSSGLGLVGMQERIALLNGELSTGPRTDGQGFLVHARLPIDE